MKKKIGVITFINADNNGAFLQAYALQTYLEKLGYDVEQIVKNQLEIDSKLSKEKKEQLEKYIYYRNKYIKFIEEDISTPYKKYTVYSKYNAVITGSDQVWNKWHTDEVFDKDYFLATVPSSVRRISYAASIGEENLYTDKVAYVFKSKLKSVDCISVREESAKKFLNKTIDYRKVERHIDPSMLLDAKDYMPLIEDTPLDLSEKYILLFLVGANETIIEYTRKLSEKYNLRVIHNYEPGTFKNEKCLHFSVGEFLGYIKNAEVVITGSFHGIIFSLLFRKKIIPFVVMRGIRVTDLLELLHLEKYLNPTDLIDLKNYNIDFNKIEKIIKSERMRSKEYLIDSIEKDISINDSYFDVQDKFSCYGCSACENVCPVGAITMVQDDEGFMYPSVDKEKCINCGLCKKKCIYKNEKLVNKSLDRDTYCGYSNSDNDLKECTSGGICKVLSDLFLSKKGYVVGVRYDENLIPYYDITNDKNVVNQFRGSKYVNPKLNDIYKKTKEKLENGKDVLFIGTSCIVAGLKSFLNKEYKNLLTVDFTCHGCPSVTFFEKYKLNLEKNYNKKIIDFNFRYKDKDGWNHSNVRLKFDDGSEHIETLSENDYFKCFERSLVQKRSCYNCEFFMYNKPADITVCDYWGIREDKHLDMFNDNKGLSGIMINTNMGKKYFDIISSECTFKKIPFEDVFSGNLNFPIELKEERFKFFDDFKNPPVDLIMSQYISKPPKKKVSKSRAIFRILVPLEIRKKVKKIGKKGNNGAKNE